MLRFTSFSYGWWILMERETLRKLVHIALNALAKVEFIGAENIPPTGGVIFATNHMSRIDIPLLFDNPVRPDITALVTDKYQDYAFIRWFTETAQGIWIDRTKADFTAFRQAAEVLQAGKALGIAPEGTRSESRELIEGKSGTALLAMRTGTPVIPVAVWGTELAVHDWKRLRRAHLVTHFGKPLTLAPLGRDDREAGLQRYTDEIMCQIAALLPTQYHGFYAHHPRLQEILR